MTVHGNPSDDATQWQQDVERRLSTLEGARPANNTTVTGALIVLDDTGGEVARVGQQADGTFDIGSIDPDDPTGFVLLSTLARGIDAGFVSTAETLSLPGSFGNLATAGPAATVTIGPSGRAWVIAGAEVWTQTEVGAWHGGRVAFDLTGANVRAAEQIAKLYAPPAGEALATVAGARLLTGLNPGSTTFTLRYGTASGSTNTVLFEDRWLLVQPF